MQPTKIRSLQYARATALALAAGIFVAWITPALFFLES